LEHFVRLCQQQSEPVISQVLQQQSHLVVRERCSGWLSRHSLEWRQNTQKVFWQSNIVQSTKTGMYLADHSIILKTEWVRSGHGLRRVGLFGIGTFTQVNSIASAVKNFFDPDMAHTVSLFGGNYSWATVIAGLFLTVCVGLVVLGGIQRIAKVSEVIVPFMAVLYVGLAVIIIIANITAVPAALASIVKSAFTGSALAGGAVGSMFVAMQKGVARGIFSNESGLGSAPIAAAAARTKEPVRQGLVSMTGTFIDTIVICTMTGLSIVIAGSWLNPELEGVAITMDAFQKGLPFPSFVATFSLMLCLVFFAFTTILGWNYYGERCVEYLFNRNKGVVMGYRILYILAVFIGPYMTVKAVWNIADIFNALMAFPNLIALLALNGVIVKETRDFHAKHNGSY